MVVLAFIVLYLLIRTAILNAASDKNHEPALLRILIDYFHIVMILKFYDLNWPPTLESALDVLSIIGECNERIFSIDCYIKGNFKNNISLSLIKLIITLFAPLFFVFLMYVTWRYCCCCQKSKKSKEKQRKLKKYSIFQGIKDDAVKQEEDSHKKKEKLIRNTVISTSLLFYVTYPLFCMKALSVYGCTELDDGQQYLIDDISVLCWGTEHKVWMILLAIPCMLIWVLGAPLYFYYRLFRNHHLLKFKDVLEYWGFYYNGLKDSHYHWFFFTTAIKVILVIFNKTLGFHNMIYKALFANLVLVIYKQQIIKYQPYVDDQLNRLSVVCSNILLLTSFFGIFFSIEDNRRWDLLKNGPVDLYENSVDYPMVIVAGLIISHLVFILLWIREFLIMHRQYFIKKTPKTFAKWIDKITERPFNLSLRWLCAIPEEDGEDSQLSTKEQKMLKIIQDEQSINELSSTINLNATTSKLLLNESQITINNKVDIENQDQASKNVSFGHYNALKQRIGKNILHNNNPSQDSTHPLSFTINDLGSVFDESQLYGDQSRFDNQFEQTKDISFAQYIRDLHKTDKQALKSIIPEYEDSRHNFLNRVLNQEQESVSSIQIKPDNKGFKKRLGLKRGLKNKTIQKLQSFYVKQEETKEITDIQNDFSSYQKTQFNFDIEATSIQNIRMKQHSTNTVSSQISQQRRRPINAHEIESFTNQNQDTINHVNQSLNEASQEMYNYKPTFEEISSGSDVYDIYQGSSQMPPNETIDHFEVFNFTHLKKQHHFYINIYNILLQRELTYLVNLTFRLNPRNFRKFTLQHQNNLNIICINFFQFQLKLFRIHAVILISWLEQNQTS